MCKDVGKLVITDVPEDMVLVDKVDEFKIYVFRSDGSQRLISHKDNLWFPVSLSSVCGGCVGIVKRYPKEMGTEEQLKRYITELLTIGFEVVELDGTDELGQYIMDNPDNGCNAP